MQGIKKDKTISSAFSNDQDSAGETSSGMKKLALRADNSAEYRWSSEDKLDLPSKANQSSLNSKEKFQKLDFYSVCEVAAPRSVHDRKAQDCNLREYNRNYRKLNGKVESEVQLENIPFHTPVVLTSSPAAKAP